MFTLLTIALISNGLMLTIALGSLFIILWQDARRESNIYFGIFMLAMMVWASGSLLSRITALASADLEFTLVGLRLLEIGFGAACISLYLLTITTTEIQSLLFRSALLSGLFLLFVYQAALALLQVEPDYTINADGILLYQFGIVNGLIYLAFSVTTLAVVWRNFNRIRQPSLSAGFMLFSFGQTMALISPRLREFAFAEITSTIATLILSYAFVRRQVMEPLLGHTKQLEVVRDVGLAITSLRHFEDVLETIATQAANLLSANASAIFLKQGDELVLKAAAVIDNKHTIPERFIGNAALKLGEGVVGTVAVERQGRLLNSYRREWKGKPDIPMAFETFGALLCVPLVYRDEVVGVLLVVSGRGGRLFDKEDMHLLELLAPQSAVAISNSRLYDEVLTSQDQLKTVLFSTENPVLAVDRKLNIIFANPALAKIIGSDVAEEISNRSLFDFVSRDLLPENLRQFNESIKKTHSFVYEVHIRNHDYWCHVAPLTQPKKGWVAVLNDITRLKEVDRLKSEMVRMTSHDLRNPLSSIIAYMDLLGEDGNQVFSDTMQKNYEAIWTQVKRMQRIIEGILNLERVESGAPPLESFDLRKVLVRCVKEMEGQAASGGLILHEEIQDNLPPIFGDAQQIGQAITNLVDNAIKFTSPGGSVWVRAQQLDGQILISIQDTGIGIPREAQSRVFDRFFRVENHSHKQIKGSGLGLSLVKAVVDRHNGRIWFHSEENKGTTFSIILPIVSRATRSEIAPEAEAAVPIAEH